MRRVRLLCWRLFSCTPLDREIDEQAEREAAEHCKLTWKRYCQLKSAHPDLWERAALKRQQAKLSGGFAPQPSQLARWRRVQAPAKAKMRKDRPRFHEWAWREHYRQKDYEQAWRRHRSINRVMARLMGL